MKRKAADEKDLEGPDQHPSKRLLVDEAQQQPDDTTEPDGDAGADTGSVFSAADSAHASIHTSSTTPQPTPTHGTAAGTSITASSPGSRISRRFPSDLKTIKCSYAGCPKTFNRPARLAAHLRSHTNDRPHRCSYPDCGKAYLEEKHLTQHIKGSHTHEKKYTCLEPGCDKSFVTATRLRRHAAVHEGADRFRCRDFAGCSQSFRKHQTLQRHVRVVHLGQAAYPCGNDGCDGGFDTAGALRRHIEREHGELRFWCAECAGTNDNAEEDDDGQGGRRVGFTTLLLLQAHMRREHMSCMFCEARCGTQRDLEHHIDLHHSGTTVEDRKTVPCIWEGCDKKFTRVSNLNTHVKTAHEGHRFVCGEVDTFETPDIADWNWTEEGCGHAFMSKLKLEEHVRFVHLGRQRPPRMYAVGVVHPESLVKETAGVVGVGRGRDIACAFEGCAARFIRHHDLQRHLVGDHGGGEEQEDLGEAPGGGPPAPAPVAGMGGGGGGGEFAIDPKLQQQIEMGGAVKREEEDDNDDDDNDEPLEPFWFAADDPLPHESQQESFETEWAEMRRLIDLDALVDRKP
ncbi:hypothetical protein B0T17DRAFT_598818 [Bombardia bombarda]|uniref:C2H2-type domain-containing protein n=1 Tax=Bombardia bombarda TaxID=252184 RepID=A0AA39XB44_9PEZI|nr:hypothetical protein B0T17DRAFT_598818 [Bombardia bombarda]